MKTFKDPEHALLIRPFELRNKTYLAVSVMLLWDLVSGSLLGEQELWTVLPPLLGPQPILDQGMPKPRGEFLLTGEACAPKSESRQATRVSVRIGPHQKSLDVFGDRFWEQGPSGWSITAPRPFQRMSLTWDRAFGGPGSEWNPQGKGLASIQEAEGLERLPLPNLEAPGRLMGHPSDRPMPASLGPVDLSWLPRSRKTGTYGDRWLRERWPGFPDDFNYEFFNTASEDQFLEGFFQGGEAIELQNLHPDLPFLESTVPAARIRSFATQMPRLSAPQEEDVFREIPMRMDTVWLFPGVLRGLVLHRGVLEILDEDLADLRRLMIVTEIAGSAPQSLEHYQEIQRKKADLTVPSQEDIRNQVNAKVQRAMLEFNRLPQLLQSTKDRFLKPQPVMPREPSELLALGKPIFQESHNVLDRTEALARDLHGRFGHLMKIDLEGFEAQRQGLHALEHNMEAHAQRATQIKAELTQKAAGAQKALDQYYDALPPDLQAHVDKASLVAPNLDGQPKVNPWHDRAFPFSIGCKRQLEQSEAWSRLRAMGFKLKTLHESWMGLHMEDLWDQAEAWGLDPGPLSLPSGLVLPRFREAILVRLLVLKGWPEAPVADCEEYLVPSSETSSFYRAQGRPEAPILLIRSELEALFLFQVIGDVASVLALTKPGQDLSPEAKAALKTTQAVIRIGPVGQKQELWSKLHPDLQCLDLPRGRDLFEARSCGTDLRNWILDHLPPESLQLSEELADPVPPGEVQKPDPQKMQALIQGTVDEVLASKAPALEKVQQLPQKLQAAMAEAAQKAGLDPSLLKARPSEPKSMAQIGEESAQAILQEMERMRAKGVLSSETEAQFRAGEASIRKLGHDSDQLFTEGMAKVEAAKQQIADMKKQLASRTLPSSVKEAFEAQGMDIDRMVKRSREEVISMHARGESLAWADLSGVDLSGLDLQSIDLRKAQLMGTNFSQSCLDNARLEENLAEGADFSRASLVGAQIEKGIFAKAKFIQAQLEGTRFFQSILQEADFSDCRGQGLQLDMCILQGTIFKDSQQEAAHWKMCIHQEGDATGTHFRRAKLEQCILGKSRYDRADFSQASTPKSLFQSSVGEDVSFAGADLSQGRMGMNCKFPKADFRGITMKEGCFRESDLSGSNFTGAKIQDSILESCDLHHSRMEGISAQGTRFTKSDLEGAKMRGINALLGSFRKARLVQADLTESNLFGCDLFRCILGGSRLQKAQLKRTLIHQREDLL